MNNPVTDGPRPDMSKSADRQEHWENPWFFDSPATLL
jgi:hypothetical protein